MVRGVRVDPRLGKLRISGDIRPDPINQQHTARSIFFYQYEHEAAAEANSLGTGTKVFEKSGKYAFSRIKSISATWQVSPSVQYYSNRLRPRRCVARMALTTEPYTSKHEHDCFPNDSPSKIDGFLIDSRHVFGGVPCRTPGRLHGS